MHYNVSKLLLCFLFGMTSSELYSGNRAAFQSARLSQKRMDSDNRSNSNYHASSGKRLHKPSGSTNSNNSTDTSLDQNLTKLSSSSAVIGAKGELIEFTPKQLASHVASKHISDSHVTKEGKTHLSSVYPDEVVKLITGTKEGYMFEHMSLISNFKNSEHFTALTTLTDHPTGGPLESGGLWGDTKKLNDAVRDAYAELVTQVTTSKTSKDFEMLLACTGGTKDGEALTSDNSHQKLLTEELNKVSFTINGKTYTGINGLKEIEEKLQSSNLSVADKTALAHAEEQLSQKIADAVNTYHDANKQGMGSAKDDIYFNKSAYEEYTTKLKETDLYKNVLEMASKHSEILNQIGSMNSAELRNELMKYAGDSMLEQHHLSNTLGLIDASNAAYTHLKNIDLEEFTKSHPLASSEYTNSDGGKAHDALKAFYNSIPLSYDGVMAAISVTGGSKDGKSHQDLIKEKFATQLTKLEQLHKEFSENPTQANQDSITAAAKDLQEKLIKHVTETIDFNKKDNAYLHYGELSNLHANRESTYSAHYEQVSSIYRMHETTAAAHTAAINNAKKSASTE